MFCAFDVPDSPLLLIGHAGLSKAGPTKKSLCSESISAGFFSDNDCLKQLPILVHRATAHSVMSHTSLLTDNLSGLFCVICVAFGATRWVKKEADALLSRLAPNIAVFHTPVSEEYMTSWP
ncbi:hypothetical protein AHF37_08777 [Paragonimus kellicotti]|nr:hypothetical protein AHF37_08777 [Paragonimus kellicotti]